MKKFLKVLFFATVAVALILVGSVFAASTIAKADGGSQPECFSFSFVKVCVWPLGVETEEVETEIVVEEDAEEVETEIMVEEETELVETDGIVDETYFPEYSCSTLASCPISVVPDSVFIVGFPRGCNTANVKVFWPGEVINYAGMAEIHAYNIALTTDMPRFNMTAFIESQYQDIFACRP